MEMKNICPHCGSPLNDVGKVELEQFHQSQQQAIKKLQEYIESHWVKTWVEKYFWVLLAIILVLVVLPPHSFLIRKMLVCAVAAIVLSAHLGKKIRAQTEQVENDFVSKNPELEKYLDVLKKKNRSFGRV